MISDSFDDRFYTGVSYTESFSSFAVDIGFSRGGAIEGYVADDYIFLRYKPGISARVDDQATSGKTLSEVVIGFAFQLKVDSFGQESSKSLACRTVEFEMDGVFGQPHSSIDF